MSGFEQNQIKKST